MTYGEGGPTAIRCAWDATENPTTHMSLGSDVPLPPSAPPKPTLLAGAKLTTYIYGYLVKNK
jgi:hypothetical protein